MPEINIEVFYKNQSVYTGRWQNAPEAVRTYIESVRQSVGNEGLLDYLKNRPDPVALLYKGYAYRVM